MLGLFVELEEEVGGTTVAEEEGGVAEEEGGVAEEEGGVAEEEGGVAEEEGALAEEELVVPPLPPAHNTVAFCSATSVWA